MTEGDGTDMGMTGKCPVVHHEGHSWKEEEDRGIVLPLCRPCPKICCHELIQFMEEQCGQGQEG